MKYYHYYYIAIVKFKKNMNAIKKLQAAACSINLL